jgi:myo-inositol-1(or 4)-monophosphatase
MRIQKTVTPVDIGQAHAFAVRATEDAGALLREGVGGDLGLRVKDPSGDLVSDLDLAAEALIVERIRAAYPEHRILAEESGLHEAGDGAFVWLVDPLDGTNNVAIGLRAYVVGVALCAGQRPVLGVVHDPVSGETYSAIRGRGAHGPDGATLRVPYRPAGHGLVLAWTQGHDVAKDDPNARALKLTLESGARRMLQLWTPLLSWIMVARGHVDGFVGYRPEGVDLPAGYLIAREAGIAVRGLDGSPFEDSIQASPEHRGFVAGRAEVLPRLLDLVAGARQVRVEGLPVSATPATPPHSPLGPLWPAPLR